ncbi:ABC transporter permease [Paucibacter sediminis]|uniref:ABC transporter permease n=1 Tax=Paucibacter sediminis TaxID=3019553 RepID=A0AA95SM37_9BURK|nr:FtsX-like permease family protein [Paucibacter sp. S2-9]WIT12863.1 ABC transporter permease [Paucibacter sp. S2-9]
MSLHLGPIFKTLRRHKIAAGLIVLEVGLSCAIICNAVFLIGHRLAAMQLPSGFAEQESVVLQLAPIRKEANVDAATQRDLALLRGLPGVQQASVLNQVPFGDSSNNGGISRSADAARPDANASWYLAGEGWLASSGLRLLAGRDFHPEEYQSLALLRGQPDASIPGVLISRTLAEHFFPGESALGKEVYPGGNKPVKVLGVIETLGRVRPGDVQSQGDYAVVLPVRVGYDAGVYLLRAQAGQREAVIKAARAALLQADRRRVFEPALGIDELRQRHFQQDRYMAWTLALVCLVLLVVTALGIIGLANFWVRQRSRMIGTRRALGATRGQILRYFQLENLLLSALGIALGMVAAYAINLALMLNYQLPRLPLAYLPVGALALLALGQLAVLGPARRAAALPPVQVLRG